MKVCIIGSYAKALVMTADRIPVAGETLMGRDYRGEFGGKGSDMAVQSSRLGAEVSYIGVIGDDTFGKEFVDLMKDEKIDISGLRITKEKSTGTGFIIRQELERNLEKIKDIEARNVIVVDSGANDLFSKEDIDNAEKLIEEADVVLAQLEIPLDTALYAMKVAKKYGKTTILNPAPAVNLKECDLSDVDILTPNETEARVAVGVPTDSELTNSEIAEMLFKTGCKKIIMTLGDKGSGIFEPGVARQVQPYKIEVVDSNGAGDCFNASLATALAAGKEIDESVLYANAVSALCCTKWETVPSYHTAAEVKEFMKKHGKKEIV